MVNEKVTHLTQRQHLIKRINLTFGRELGDNENPYSTQKLVAIREILDNAVDILRKLDRKGTIKITFNEDYSVECYDSGTGIPIEENHTADGKKTTSLYLALGVMNAGSNYENVTDSLGTNGVGASASQMLSEYTKVEVYRDKKKYRLDFKDGEIGLFDEKGNFKQAKDLTFLHIEKDNRSLEEKKEFPTGTKIKIKLNEDLFKSKYPYNEQDLIARLRGVALLCPKITIQIYNHLKKFDGAIQTELFQFDDGLKELVELHSNNKIVPVSVLEHTGKFIETTMDITNGEAIKKDIEKSISVSCAFTYDNDYDYFVDSYVNTIRTRLHGVHLKAFEKALVSVLNSKFRSMRTGLSKKDDDPIMTDYAEGLKCVVSVRIPEPEFTNQIKEELGGQKAFKEFTKLFTQAFEKWVNSSKNAETIKIIADKVISASKNRISAKELQAIKREKSKLERTSSMPSKLVDCRKTYDENSELFLCLEGNTEIQIIENNEVLYKKIKDLVGYKDIDSFSTDEKGKIFQTKIKEVFKTNQVTETLKITFEDSSFVECTGEHKFLDKATLKWVKASDIRIGQNLATGYLKNSEEGHSFLTVQTIGIIFYEKPISVYCLNIDSKFHSFLLSNDLITHNCEGDSAMGGLKAARNSEFQALLPLRGKIINTLKAPLKNILDNNEIKDIIKCLDAGVGKDFDLTKSRYGKVIIATDADVDGSNIACLIVTLFWKLFPKVIEEGRLYKACTPLFIVHENKNTHYCFTEEEYNTLLSKLEKNNKKITKVVRAKGLGESGSKVLFDTGMNPETRRIEKIVIDDVEKAREYLEITMGEDVESRRKWIEDNPVTNTLNED